VASARRQFRWSVTPPLSLFPDLIAVAITVSDLVNVDEWWGQLPPAKRQVQPLTDEVRFR
jgi:hypothetical protein